MSRAAITAAAVAAALAVAATWSCGPSFRRTYQSDGAFLRCFDLDYRPGVAAADKEGCWRAWLERRVYNQPEDKIRYAELRLAELSRGVSVPGPPGPPGAFDRRPEAGGEGAPSPSAPVVPVEADGADGGVADGGLGAAAPCKEPCGAALVDCKLACGGASACATACDEGFFACMGACGR